MKYYICEHCGNLVEMVESSGVPIICCGQNMTELVPNTVDASREKHVPVVVIEGNKVNVTIGSVDHPMFEEHFIKWIVLETCKGTKKRVLKPNEDPKAEFILSDDECALSVYAYCNLHGLWENKLK